MRVFKVTGKVISSETKNGIKGLRVEAWDKDLLVNDLVGSAITGEGGVFRMQFDESCFKEIFFDRKPDLFFKVFKGDQLIKSTEDSILWNVEREDIDQIIEVEEVNGMETPIKSMVSVKQRGSEVFRFVTLRPFQRQSDDQITAKKVLCYGPENPVFHKKLVELRDQPDAREKMLEEAREYIEQNPGFVKDVNELWPNSQPRSVTAPVSVSSLGTLEEWIFKSEKPINYDDFLQKIRDVYKYEPVIIVGSSGATDVQDGFRNDRSRLRDAIIALAIDSTNVHPQSDHLINALRICRIIERMAEDDPRLKEPWGIDKAMKAPVLLPADVFPLPSLKRPDTQEPPDNHQEQELNRLRERRNNIKTAIKELERLRPEDFVPPPEPPLEEPPVLKLQEKEIEQLSTTTKKILKELGIDPTKTTLADLLVKLGEEGHKGDTAKTEVLKAAIEELAKIAASRSLTSFPEPKKAISLEGRWKPFVLKEETLARLKDTTKQSLEELGLDLAKDTVPQMVNALEEELARVGAQLFRPPRRKKMIRYGLSRLEFLPGELDLPDIETQPWLPGDLGPIRVPMTHRLVRPLGFGELNVVNQHLLRYEAGEIAHIENVLRGEYKERVHRRLRRFEEEITIEEERKTTSEKDLQSTDRFELKREATETIKEDHKAEAGVTDKYDGPTVDVEAKAGYTYSHSKEQAKSTSVTYARDVTQRSLSKLEEKVREVRVEKTIEEFEETNTHGIDNKGKPDHAVGIYRWVDKFYEAQVVNYGQRLFFDFVIPDPAALYLYALTHNATTDLEEPLPPMVDENGDPCEEDDPTARPLMPDDIQSDNYMTWVALYGVSGIEPLPARFKYVAETFCKAGSWTNNEPEYYHVANTQKIVLPTGYNVVCAYAIGHAEQNYGYAATIIGDQVKTHIGSDIWHLVLDFPPEGDKYDSEGDKGFPVSIKLVSTTGYVMNVLIKCERSKEEVEVWQLETYDAIMQAYLKKKSEYEEKLAMAAIQEGISISGRNPEQNREIEETELKRWALSMITGQHFELFNAMQTDSQGLPGINFAEAEAEGSYIQFFEQAFEWPLMTYIFYPYFWGRRKAPWEGGLTWLDKITNIQDVDPLFEKFLTAGAARVRVPVRLGYEDAVISFVERGVLWNGGEKPGVDDPLYVSIVEEIQQQQGVYIEKTGGTLKVTQGSPEVNGNGTDFEDSDIDREIFIEGKRYVIGDV